MKKSNPASKVGLVFGVSIMVLSLVTLPDPAFAEKQGPKPGSPKGASEPHWKKDKDNNPPGLKGGPGTNWENPPGPRGGLGVGPDLNKPRPQAWVENHPKMAERLDTNNDGTVTKGEFREGRPELRKEPFEEWAQNHPELAKRMDANQDGTVDQVERQAARAQWAKEHPRRDFDNNPPDPQGGPGTNWENPPGPKGGPGVGPDRKRDFDNNPPGPRGGLGTNWENPPGKRGGPGASPNRMPMKQGMKRR